MEPITSRANARLKAARKLQAKRNRLAAGLFLAEGEDIVEEALSEGICPPRRSWRPAARRTRR
jgi:tRNA G18 (ribose-2'-O)-methylase SpoU